MNIIGDNTMKSNFGKSVLRIVAAGVAAVTAFGGVAACGDADSSDPNKITFWFWGSPAEVAVYEQLIAQYEDEHPGVTIAPTHYESGIYMGKFQAERKKPDVFFMPDTDFAAWVDAGIMLNLDSSVSREELDAVWPAAVNEYRYDVQNKTLGSGSLYGFPKDLGPVCLTYNKKIVERQIAKNDLDRDVVYELLDPTDPMTWDEFRGLLKDLTRGETELYGIPYYEMDSALYSNDANYFTDDASTQKIDDNFIDAVVFNIQLATVDKVMPSADVSGATDAYTRFFNGKTIFTWMGPWDNADFWNYDLEYDICPVPYNGKNPNAQSVTFAGSMCYGVSAKTKKPDVAVDFAKWLSMSTSCQKKALELGQQVPNLMEMAKTDYISADWKVQPEHRSLFVDIIDGNTNSIGLYKSAADDKISSKTRPLYYTYDSTWKDNLMSYMSEGNLWRATDAAVIRSKLESYRDDLQSDLDLMNERWKG